MLRVLPLLLAAAVLTLAPSAVADPGKPVGVRWWGQAYVTIETWWGLTVAIDPYALRIGYDDPNIGADLVLITHNHFDHNNPDIVQGSPQVARALDEKGEPQRVNLVLDRFPNQEKPVVARADMRIAHSDNAIYVESIPADHDDSQGSERGRIGMFLIRADGLRILHCADLGQAALTDEQLAQIGDVDVLLIPVGGVYTIDGAGAAKVVEQIKPRFVVPIHYKTDTLTINLQPVDGFLAALPARYERVSAIGNTLAAAAGAGPTKEKPRVVVLRDFPWRMPDDLGALFEKKETASLSAQEVIRPLSVNQLNHKPANGTHTPRWNAEHTAGTELLVMSSIYSNRDPSISVINLMPAQMPPDYKPAHPDWDGFEQAAYMERVEDFSRRFAYLLEGDPLDELPEGAPKFFKSLRGFLEKMADHYGEHIAHVKEKFDLPDWPKE
jgi:L-ascorbate metabolism protein UlaG (beta-lactamase superfamily)